MKINLSALDIVVLMVAISCQVSPLFAMCGETTLEIVRGLTSRTIEQADAKRLRRFAVTVIARVSDKTKSVAEQMRRLQRNTRLVFDYLRMTQNLAAAAH